MADFCTVCAHDMGFNTDINIDIIFKELDKGTYVPVLCEGCSLNAIGKSEEGKLILSKYGQNTWISFTDYFKLPDIDRNVHSFFNK